MAQETVRLARYAAALRYEDLPAEIVIRAKECIVDTVAAIICGASLPWSRIVIAYAERTGPGGNCRILGAGGTRVTAPAAALANGALAHAFELDSLTRPGAGVHPGATLLPPALALAQHQGLGGRALIAAFVAGCEVMVRIGRATGHTNEQRGFHAPGNTGPFGGAVAGGHLLGLDAEAMANALGIAGSLACGLLEFARAGSGGMVKRLHLGRASEGGVLAASLAHDGFTAPDTVLEGPFGFLAVFCREWDVGELTKGLGEKWATRSIALKRYPCHINAHAAVKALSQLQAEHGFAGGEVESVAISGSERMAGLHNIPEPADLMMAQYSVPFCAALALYRDPRNPESFAEGALDDPEIRALCRRVTIEAPAAVAGHGAAPTTVTVSLKGGRQFRATVADGTLAAGDLGDKFLRLTRGALGAERAASLFERLQHLENEAALDWLGAEV
ncbi:MAG TPA: MmgE/PrpD family protein [Stellaceae bacterium]|nr:MmgE/PrpD family protein [Stellaceae bacterium]